MQYLGTMNEPTDLVNRQYVTQNAGSGDSGDSGSSGDTSGGTTSEVILQIVDNFYNNKLDIINGESI